MVAAPRALVRPSQAASFSRVWPSCVQDSAGASAHGTAAGLEITSAFCNLLQPNAWLRAPCSSFASPDCTRHQRPLLSSLCHISPARFTSRVLSTSSVYSYLGWRPPGRGLARLVHAFQHGVAELLLPWLISCKHGVLYPEGSPASLGRHPHKVLQPQECEVGCTSACIS